MLFQLIFAMSIATASNKTEIQINICDSKQEVLDKLNVKSWKMEPAEITRFVENKEIQFYKKGWVFKIIESTENESFFAVLKNNNSIVPSEIKNIKCEYDLHGLNKKFACKLSNPISREHLERAQSNHDYSSLLSNFQQDWLKQNDTEFPANAELTTKFHDQDFSIYVGSEKFVLGITQGFSEDEYIELSARGPSEDDRTLQSQLLQYLQNQNVNICENQNSIHTRMKLESYFKVKTTGGSK